MYKYSSGDGVSSQMAGLSVKDPPNSSQQSTVDSSITTPKQSSRLTNDEYIPNQFGGGSHHYSRMLSTNTVTTSFRSSPSASANSYLPNQFGSNHDSVRSSPTTTVTFSNSRCFGSSGGGGGNGSSTSSATSSTMTTSRMSTTTSSSMGSQGANRSQAGGHKP